MEKVLLPSQTRNGLVLGKFLPPHRGHKYLIDFANQYCGDLTVLVCTLKRESIPGNLRYKWMRDAFPPYVRVIHVTEEVPQFPHEDPDFWDIWKNLIEKYCPHKIDLFFASEMYGFKLAEVIGAKYIPVDHPRELVPIAGNSIMENPEKFVDFLLPGAREFLVKNAPATKPHTPPKRVCIFGPESTGKSTLTKNLAKHFNTTYSSEYARGLIDLRNGVCTYDEILMIGEGQRASEEALAMQANRVFFTDTDALTTTLWSDVLFNKCPEWITALAKERTYDLTLLLNVDTPWVDDIQRYLPHAREEFFERCKKTLEEHQRPYVIIEGSWEKRLQSAIHAVEQL